MTSPEKLYVRYVVFRCRARKKLYTTRIHRPYGRQYHRDIGGFLGLDNIFQVQNLDLVFKIVLLLLDSGSPYIHFTSVFWQTDRLEPLSLGGVP